MTREEFAMLKPGDRVCWGADRHPGVMDRVRGRVVVVAWDKGVPDVETMAVDLDVESLNRDGDETRPAVA